MTNKKPEHEPLDELTSTKWIESKKFHRIRNMDTEDVL